MNRDAARGSQLPQYSAVMSRSELLSETSDLGRLCRPRRLSTVEVFEPNAYYGNDVVLKSYAGLPIDRPLKVVVPHGVVFDQSYVWGAERRASLPAVLAYNSSRAQAYARSTRMLRIPCAVPFAYLPKILGEATKQRSGTLFFPSHSSHRLTAQSDYVGMATRLVELEAELQPVTVCIYWRDYELGRHKPFVERGLKVVSAGHIYDPGFLFRLYCLCQEHRFAASNSVGSSLLYSVLAGCSYFLLPEFRVAYTGAPDHLASDLSHGGDVQEAIAREFSAPVDGISASQSHLVAEICGLDHLLSPRMLRDALLMAERLDRFGMARDPQGRRFNVTVPRRYVRAGRHLIEAVRWRANGFVRRSARHRRLSG